MAASKIARRQLRALRANISPPPSDPRMEKAWRAVTEFRHMIGPLTAFARMAAKNDNIQVRLSADGSKTDGKNIIWLEPPIELGDNTPHDRRLCDKYDDSGKQLCKACHIREHCIRVLNHEIAHIVFKSMAKARKEMIDRVVGMIDEWHPPEACSHGWVMKAMARNSKTYLELFYAFSPMLMSLEDCLEDARVNAMTFVVRPGLIRLFRVTYGEIMAGKYTPLRGDTIDWSEAPLNGQFGIGLFLKASGYEIEPGQLSEEVMTALEDPTLVELAARVVKSKSIAQVGDLTLKVFARAKELGYFVIPKCEIPPPTPPMPPMPSDPSSQAGEDDDEAQSDENDEQGESGEDSDDDSTGKQNGSPDGSDESGDTGDASDSDSDGKPQQSGDGDEADAQPGESAGQDPGDTEDSGGNESGGESEGTKSDSGSNGDEGDGGTPGQDPGATKPSDSDARNSDNRGSSTGNSQPDGSDSSDSDSGHASGDAGEDSRGEPGDSEDQSSTGEDSSQGGSSGCEVSDSEGASDDDRRDPRENQGGETSGSEEHRSGASGSTASRRSSGQSRAASDGRDPANTADASPDDDGRDDEDNGDAPGSEARPDEPDAVTGEGSPEDLGDDGASSLADRQVAEEDVRPADSEDQTEAQEPSEGDDGREGSQDVSDSGEVSGEESDQDAAKGDASGSGGAEGSEDGVEDGAEDDSGNDSGDESTSHSGEPSAGADAREAGFDDEDDDEDDEEEIGDGDYQEERGDESVWQDKERDRDFEAPGEYDPEPGVGGARLDHGSPEDVEEILKAFGIHGTSHDPKEDAGPNHNKMPDDTHEGVATNGNLDNQAVGKAIAQSASFDTPRVGIRRLVEAEYPNRSSGWIPPSHDSSNYLAYEPSELVIGKGVVQARALLEENRRAKFERHLKSGPRLDRKALAREIPFGGDKIMRRKTIPGKKDYFFIFSVDFSGSTIEEERLPRIKRAVFASANMLARIGQPFAIYGMSGTLLQTPSDYDKVDAEVLVHPIKTAHQPWDIQAKRKLADLRPHGCNFDGHNFEFLRKRLDEQSATTRVILYYTDGDMPFFNFSEELWLLQHELNVCDMKGYYALGVGIGTDSPTKWGLPTVQVNSDEDIILPVAQLSAFIAEDE